MHKANVNGHVMSFPFSNEEMSRRVARASAFVRSMAGIGNNAAWSAALEANDHIRKHPRYRFEVKRAFRDAFGAFDAYEKRLIYDKDYNFFDVNGLSPEQREKYGNITAREFYDFWAGSGASAYASNRSLVTSLQDRYRLSLIEHGIPHPVCVSWALTGMACIEIAVSMYRNSISVCEHDYGLCYDYLDAIFKGFDLSVVAGKWELAVSLLEPQASRYSLTEHEEEEIGQCIERINEMYSSSVTVVDSISDAINSYDEIFRSQMAQRRSLETLRSDI